MVPSKTKCKIFFELNQSWSTSKKKHVIEIFYNIIDMSNYSEIKINKTLKLRIQIQGFVNKII